MRARDLVLVVAVVAACPCLAEWGRAPNGEFWNGCSQRYMFAPSFDFRRAGAVRYGIEITDDYHRVTSFETEKPIVSMEKLWADLPVGYVTVACRAIDSGGLMLGEPVRRTFWKKAAFTGAYPPRKRSYAAARNKIYDYFLGLPQTAYLMRTGKPDPTYPLNGYPSKMLSAEISAFLRCADVFGAEQKPMRDHYLEQAKKAADFLIAGAVPAGAPLEYFPRTYAPEGSEYGRFKGEQDTIMLVYPANVGQELVRLFKASGDRKYLEAARRIAATYLKLQGADGTWFLKQNAVTGRETAPNRLLPTGMVSFFEALHEVEPHEEYRAAADRAFAYIEKGPLTDWNWEGQFEDCRPDKRRWKNLTKHAACSTAMHLLRRYPGDAARLAQAEELVKFSEDQFVEWEIPYSGTRYAGCPTGDDDGSWNFFCRPYSVWETPCVLEQYDCYHPIDSSNDKLILSYLTLWKANGKRVYLEKAKALGDTLTRVQAADGHINTWLVKNADQVRNDSRYHTWINCLLATANALDKLAEVDAGAEANQFQLDK